MHDLLMRLSIALQYEKTIEIAVMLLRLRPTSDTSCNMAMQVASALSPTANYAAGQRWFTPDQAAKEHARALQHPETDFDPETGAVELHSALSSLNEATFETAQVRCLTLIDSDLVMSQKRRHAWQRRGVWHRHVTSAIPVRSHTHISLRAQRHTMSKRPWRSSFYPQKSHEVQQCKKGVFIPYME